MLKKQAKLNKEEIMKKILEGHRWQRPLNFEGIHFNTVLYEIDGYKFIVEDHYWGSKIWEVKKRSKPKLIELWRKKNDRHRRGN